MGPEMVEKIYRSRVKYALEHAYELRANLDILRDEIIQETAVLRVDPSPKTTRFGPEVGGGGGVNKSLEEAFCLCKETATEQLEGKKQRYHDQRLLLKRVEQGLRRLPGDYERILRWKAGFEHHRLTWNQIGNRLNEDSSYCRRRYDEGIDILTGIVYGAAAFPIQGVLDMDTSLEQEKILATDFDKNRQE